MMMHLKSFVFVTIMIMMASNTFMIVNGFMPLLNTISSSSSTIPQLLSFTNEKRYQLQNHHHRPSRISTSSRISSTTSSSTSDESMTTTTTDVNKLDGRKIRGIVQPCNNFVLVKTADVIESTTGGIILTGKAKIRKTEGIVIAVGPGKTHQDSGIIIDMPVKIGDGVVYGKYDGTTVMYNDKSHTLIRDEDILIKYNNNIISYDNVEVIHDHVLVRIDSNSGDNDGATSIGGILLAKTTDKTKASTGTVVKIGPGKIASNGERINMDVTIGDMIKFRDYAGNEVEMKNDDSNDYTVVRMIDILAKY